MSEQQTNPPARSRTAILSIGAILLVLAGAIGVRAWSQHRAALAQQALAEATFGPAVKALEQGVTEGPYDIDATIRVLHEVELALSKGGDLKEWLGALAQQDYRRVPREVLEARAGLLRQLQKLYALQTEVDERAAFTKLSGALMLQAAGAFSLDAAGIGFDGERMTRLVADLKVKEAQREKLQREISQVQAGLVDALSKSSQLTFKYVDEWDRLNGLRDRAYLAVASGDWTRAGQLAGEAAKQAPFDREAHLLAALAGIEGSAPGAVVAEAGPALSEPERMLKAYLDAHPGESAPALLLLGNLETKRGRLDEAKLHYEQAATYYPKQAQTLQDLLDPYKARTFLRKSREGGYIVDLYRSMMSGAGPFSPDLRLARLHYQAGDEAKGRAKVMDHFSRRRAQRDWSALLEDVRFSRRILGAHLDEIFPEASYLDLVAEPALLGSKLKLKVKNRSARTLHNATLVVALQLTDMHPDDFETFAPATQPAVLAHETTDFGELAIDLELFGVKKKVDDIVKVRAILVADEAVSWVDTEPFKLAEAMALREQKPAPEVPANEWFDVTGLTPAVVEKAVRGTLAVALEAGLGKDDLVITLPKELAIFQPTIRLAYGGEELVAAENRIEDGAIRLRFDNVANFEDAGVPRDLELRVGSRLLSFKVGVGASEKGFALKAFVLE